MLLICLVLCLCAGTHVQSQIFLKVNAGAGITVPGTGPGGWIQGESTNDTYRDQIEVLAYSNGIAGCPAGTRASGGGGQSACKTSISALTFVMSLNKSVIPMKALALSGRVIPNVEFFFVRQRSESQNEYYKIRMEDVLISSIQESGSESERPTFSVEFDARRIAWGYRVQKPDGNMGNYVTTGWDVATNKAWNFTFPPSSTTY